MNPDGNDDFTIERCLLVKPEVMIYQIPPRSSSRGYRAADWNLASPDWTGRLRFVVKGRYCELRLEDKNSGQLFAACPIEKYPGGTSIEAVSDSSRYFVICVQDSGRKAYLGMGFSDRADSFDLNVALQDHFKMVKKEDNFSKEAEKPPLNLNLALKDGQTIRVNINIPKKDKTPGSSKPKPIGGILPPPPAGATSKIGPPPGSTPIQSPSSENTPATGNLIDGFGDDDDWGDFTSAPVTSKQPSGSWVQF